jgi:hypothetical protein
LPSHCCSFADDRERPELATIVRKLLEAGADRSLTDRDGKTARDHAVPAVMAP